MPHGTSPPGAGRRGHAPFGLRRNERAGCDPRSDRRHLGLVHLWIVDVSNPTAGSTTFPIRVVCASKPKLYALSTSLFDPVAAGTATSAFATCPAGSLPLGGGGDTSATLPLVELIGSQPVGPSWRGGGVHGPGGGP